MRVKKRFFKVTFRFFAIFFAVRREFLVARKRGFDFARKKMEPRHEKQANKLFHLAVSMGGCMIKLCQYFSTRRDIFPEPYVKVLSGLQDRVPALPYSEMEPIIKRAYTGRKTPFSFIDKEPLASASLGQVHKAVLKNGRTVVLKILKPNIEDVFDTDFAILHYVFHLFSYIRFFRENFDFNKLLEEFVRVTGDELNFMREIHIAERFKNECHRCDFLVIPTVYKEYCTERIIVMDYIEGTKVDEPANWESRNNDPKIISRRLIELYLEQFLSLRLIHFDPHPGNILILDNNRLALIDFGMAGEITDVMSDGVKRVLTGFIDKDYEDIVKVLRELGFIKRNADSAMLLPIVEYFLEEIVQTVSFDRRSMQNVDFSPIIDELIETVYTQPFQLPYEWAFILKTIGVLGGLIGILDPDFQIYEELRPYVTRVIRDNEFELAERIYKQGKTVLKEAVRLPHNANRFIERSDREFNTLKYREERINASVLRLRRTIVRGIAFLLSFLSGIMAYLLFIFDHREATPVFAAVATVFFLVFLFFKNLSKKDMLKKHLLK